jgi:hypothetical protein
MSDPQPVISKHVAKVPASTAPDTLRQPPATGNPATEITRKPPRILINGSNPDESELRAVGQIMELFGRARTHKRPLVGKWYENYRMLRNEFWPGGRPGWMPAPQVPEIKPIVASMVGWMVDQRFTHTISPASLPHSDFDNFMQELAQNLEAVLQATWVVNREEVEWTKALWDAAIYGTGIVKTTWDQTLAGGIGDAITRRVNPFTFYPDPTATSMEDASYFVEVKVLSIQELDRRFPGAGKLFRDGGEMQDIDDPPDQIDSLGSRQALRGNPGAISPVTVPRYGRPGDAGIHATEAPGVTVIECWLRDHEHYTTPDANYGGDRVTRTKDSWRVVVIAGSHVLMDEPATNLWSHGGHPYDRVVFDDVGEFWGFSLVQDLSSAQKAINRILAALQMNVELTGNPVWRDVAGGNSRTTTTNRPGEKVVVNNPMAAQAQGWVNPPQISNGHIELLRYYLQRMEAVSGLSAVTRGGQPSGRNAQGVMDSLQEAAFVRVRMALHNLEASLTSAGTKKADLIIENYNTPRIVAIAGPGGTKTSLALKARHFEIPTLGGAVPMKYQLLIDAGSRLHTSRQAREDREIQLYTLGLTDEQAALEGLDYPNASVVANRVAEKKAQMMMEEPSRRQRARA